LIIKLIELKNFRNLDLVLEPDPGYNLILGANGTGKSNLLDALYHLALGKTFKPYTIKNNINFHTQKDFALIKGVIDNDGQNKELQMIFAAGKEDGERKRLEFNGKPTTRAKFINNLYLILFAPHNINLLIGTPDLRRDELDDFASLCDFKYAVYINEYKHIIRNRNRLLKAISAGQAQRHQLAYWDKKMLELGSYILAMRQKILDELAPYVTELARINFASELQQLEVVYQTRFPGTDPKAVFKLFRDQVNANQDKEVIVGQSLYGPHKDDFIINFDGNDLKVFGSRGQQRIATFLLKLAMWDYLAELKEIKPVILLDDVMSELDSRNRRLLEGIITSLNTQTFITTTHEEDYSSEFLKKMKITLLS